MELAETGKVENRQRRKCVGSESQVHDFTKLIPLPAHKALGNILLDFKDNLVLGILSKQSWELSEECPKITSLLSWHANRNTRLWLDSYSTLTLIIHSWKSHSFQALLKPKSLHTNEDYFEIANTNLIMYPNFFFIWLQNVCPLEAILCPTSQPSSGLKTNFKVPHRLSLNISVSTKLCSMTSNNFIIENLWKAGELIDTCSSLPEEQLRDYI